MAWAADRAVGHHHFEDSRPGSNAVDRRQRHALRANSNGVGRVLLVGPGHDLAVGQARCGGHPESGIRRVRMIQCPNCLLEQFALAGVEFRALNYLNGDLDVHTVNLVNFSRERTSSN